MILFFLIPWDGNIHREKQVNGYIVKAPVCANALIIVDDAQTFLIVFQVVDKGGCGQWLFQVIQTPAFIDFIEIRGFALGTLPNFKVTLGFEKAQDIVALLHRFFQIRGGAFADGKLIVVPNQPMQPFQRPKQDALFFRSASYQ